ncbi:MAG TPA: Hsp20/alpha crystallin family protein [Phycisphaerae bacterium]|mgnify:CR=1 FL=1|nr:Hsp20/alpha crystallin family protein [Phycisphaerae bacterium]HRW54978.1 Hsp20/alpha crystallin family protein [Phycisphaerae bacterium]
MNLIPWKNRSDSLETSTSPDLLKAFERRLDRLFGESVFDLANDWFDWPRGATPAIDIADDGRTITVEVDAPGMNARDFEVNVAGDVLTISGHTSSEEKEESDKGWYRRERRHGAFQRSVRLPAAIKPDAVSAEYRDGVLKVRCAKPAGMQPKRIEVKS